MTTTAAPDYRALARQAALRFLGPQYVDDFMRQLNTESHFVPGARSPVGARWIGQFMPATARQYGVHDDASSITGAARYDADLLKRYGSIERALSAYNSGRPDAYKDPNFAHGQTYNYVKSILGGASPAAAGAPGAPASMSPGPQAAPAPAVDTSALRASALQSLLGQVGKSTPDYTQFLGAAKQLRQAGGTAPQLGVQVAHDGPVSPNAVGVVKLASKYLGVKYKWGGTTPAGFDCSGFVQYLYAQKGVKVPRTTYEQFKHGTAVSRGELQPGDVVFFEPGKGGPGHEALYIGHGQVVAAPHTGTVVQIQSLAGLSKALGYVGARRLG